MWSGLRRAPPSGLYSGLLLPLLPLCRVCVCVCVCSALLCCGLLLPLLPLCGVCVLLCSGLLLPLLLLLCGMPDPLVLWPAPTCPW